MSSATDPHPLPPKLKQQILDFHQAHPGDAYWWRNEEYHDLAERVTKEMN